MGRWTVDTILTMDYVDFLSMDKKALSKVVTILDSAANKRLRRLESAEIETPAYNKAMKSGGYFSVKNKNLGELRAEFKRVRTFLLSKTSTVSGYKKILNDTFKKMRKDGVNIKSATAVKRMWEIYGYISKNTPFVITKDIKYRLRDAIIDRMNQGKTDEEIIAEMETEKLQIYEELQALNDTFETVASAFFTGN